jgi:hypothetical protein
MKTVKYVDPKKKTRKRPKTLVLPKAVIEDPTVTEKLLMEKAIPVELEPEVEPVLDIVFYAPDAPLEQPHAIVLEVQGKKSLWRRFEDWLDDKS